MKRREVMALIGGAVAAPLAFPFLAIAQQKKIPRVGIIDDGPIWEPLRQALRSAGYIEGRTIAYEYRSAEGQPERLAAAATELAQLPVDVIMTYGTPASRAAKAATSTIPIVMIAIGDPVRAGLVQSIAHPSGNITGNTILSPDLGPKRLQLIKEIVPTARRVALLWNPDNASNTLIFEQLRDAAPALGFSFTGIEARSVGDFDNAYATLLRERPDALLTTSDPVHYSNVQHTIAFLTQNRLPAMFQTRADVEAGGLMSYGANFAALFAQGAFFVDKILHGIKPADIPVQTPQRFELVINLKTAHAIGVKISEDVLLRTDAVIE